MGKALLIIVLGAGFLLARQGFNNQTTERESRKDQVEYEKEVLAREISRSGFNVAMGIAREHPNAIDAATYAVDIADGTYDGVFSGTARGGTYAVRAETLSGHSIRVTATGYYGGSWVNGKYTGASYTMSDSYRIRVLEVRQSGKLDTRFLASVAGYCSAVFMDEWMDDVKVSTRMIFPSGHNRDGSTPASSFYVKAGTQLNFFIGVDQNCSSEKKSASTCEVRTYMMNYPMSNLNSEWNYIHNALDVPTGSMEQAKESIWGLVEQLPSDRQRWRIAWEDIHNTSWDNPTSNNPRNSLQAFKIQGYDTDGNGVGNGWVRRDAHGYRALTEGGLDINDQQIEIGIRPLNSLASQDSLWRVMRAERSACGISSTDGMPPEPQRQICHSGNQMMVGETQLASHLSHGDTEGICPEPEYEVCHNDREMTVLHSALQGHLDHGDTVGACPEEEEEEEEEEETSYGCPCSSKKLSQGKVGILHRPPGNPSNEQGLCISTNAAQRGHSNHNDLVLCYGNWTR